MASKYEPLRRYLTGLASDRIRLSFDEIERILGFSLPNSARQYAPWWANTGGSHIQADAWMSSGWRTAQVDVPGERVIFDRVAREAIASRAHGAPAEPGMQAGVEDSSAPFAGDDLIVIDKATLRGGAIRMLEDYQRRRTAVTSQARRQACSMRSRSNAADNFSTGSGRMRPRCPATART